MPDAPETQPTAPRLLLLDGHSLAYRAFFALPVENFSTTTGQHTNAGRTLLRAYDAGAKRPGVLIDAGREFARAETPRDAQSAFERAVLDFPSAPETVDAHVGWARAASGRW